MCLLDLVNSLVISYGSAIVLLAAILEKIPDLLLERCSCS
jgi:hypothetical protein